MVLLCSVSASAYDLEKDGIYYDAVSSTELSVTFKSTEYKSYSGDIVIPDIVTVGSREYTVVSIGYEAFKNCKFLTSIKLPSTIRSINRYAFWNCVALETITIPGSVTVIGNFAFEHCSALTNVIIEDSNTRLELNCNTTTFTSGSRDKELGQFCSCPIDSVYIGRNIYTNMGSGYSYAPFKGSVKITFGVNVTSIPRYLVTYYSSPNSITMLGKTPPEVYETMLPGFSSTTLYVPFPSLETYKSTPVWDKFQTILPYYQDYKATFMIDNEIIDEIIIKEGNEITPPTAPEKEGHTFTGWIDLPQVMPSEDIIIYGSYNVNKYKLIYIIDNAVYSTSDVEYDSTIEPIDEPEKEGHSFNGWIGLPNTMPAEDIVVIGTFSVNSYTVTFMIDNEVYKTFNVKYGAEIELPSVPEKEGYTFSGWGNVPETMPAKDIIIQGSYIADTAIEDIFLDLENIEVYNLKGVRITETDKLTRGIYIINGNKTFVK